MPLWDVTSAGATTELGKFWDINSAGTTTQLNSLYDVTSAGASTLLWTDEDTFVPGTTATVRGSTGSGGTFYAYANNYSGSSGGGSGAAYITVNLSAYSTMKIKVTLTTVPTYGWLIFGIANWSAYTLTSWPTVTLGYAINTISTTNGYSNGQVLDLSYNVAGHSGNYQIGVGAISRSSVSAYGYITLNSLILAP